MTTPCDKAQGKPSETEDFVEKAEGSGGGLDHDRRGVKRRFHMIVGAARTSGTGCSGTGAKRLVHDFPNGAGATAALRAASQTAIYLARRARRLLRRAHGAAHIVIGKDVAGTNDHVIKRCSRVGTAYRYSRPRRHAKQKHRFSSNSKLRRHRMQIWNRSKEVPVNPMF